MLKRRWGFAIAFGLIIIISVGANFLWSQIQDYQIEQSNELVEAAQSKQEEIKKYLDACLLEDPNGIVKLFVCVTKAAKADRQTITTHYDLKAQQEMAVWAYIIVWFTGAGLAVSGFGLFFLLISLEQTRTAIKDNREIGEAQTLPYFDATIHGQCSRLEEGTEVTVQILNSGATPAFNITVDGEYQLIVSEREIGSGILEDKSRNSENVFLGKGALKIIRLLTREDQPFDLVDQQPEDIIANGECFFDVKISTKYEAVFDKKATMIGKFRFRFDITPEYNEVRWQDRLTIMYVSGSFSAPKYEDRE